MGRALARALAEAGHRVVPVPGRRAAAGEASAEVRHLLSSADTIFLATPDDAIVPLAQLLATHLPDDRRGLRTWLHTSGALGWETLSPLHQVGEHVGSLHPLQTIPAEAPPEIFHGALAAIDASDPAGHAVAAGIARALGMHPVAVPGALRPLYHTAAWFASGAAVLLVAEARRLMETAGIPAPDAARGVAALAERAIATATGNDFASAVTGPLVRGDAATIRRHLEALRRQAPDLLPAYRALALATLARLDPPLDPAGGRDLRTLIETP